jgi:NDP-4-keto-2,6-dideoxyhexose 3-C-methyltransferase
MMVIMANPIEKCRICGGESLEEVLDLGIQYLTGVFPRTQHHPDLAKGPLGLVRCADSNGCGLVQLSQSYEPVEMYGTNYGYRSGLNRSMVDHLKRRVNAILSRIPVTTNDVVIDIASNDGTSLGFYPPSAVRIGIDPTAGKYEDFYPENVIRVCDFFSKDSALSASNFRRASVITAFSVMYDLEDPVSFVRQVADVLDPNGIFVLEQSYLPLMLERHAFDTICHEHIEYYGLSQIDWILKLAGLEAIDMETNDINGGSFAVTAAHRGRFKVSSTVQRFRDEESSLWVDITARLNQFRLSSEQVINDLKNFVQSELVKGKTFAALGASTKGNVLLQAANLGPNEITQIGDVNPDKFGAFTPGTGIPILPEVDVLGRDFDYFIVLPWHFRNFFLNSPQFRGRRLVFPLPQLDVVVP